MRKEDGRRVTSMGSVTRKAFEPSSMLAASRAAFATFARRSRSRATCVSVRSWVWKCARGPCRRPPGAECVWGRVRCEPASSLKNLGSRNGSSSRAAACPTRRPRQPHRAVLPPSRTPWRSNHPSPCIPESRGKPARAVHKPAQLRRGRGAPPRVAVQARWREPGAGAPCRVRCATRAACGSRRGFAWAHGRRGSRSGP